MGIFDKAKELGNGALNATKKMSSGITNKIAESSHDERAAEHSMYELFVPGYGLGVKFAFTESSIIYGKEEYPYAELDPIQMINPATRITNGTAQTRANGKALTLAYESDQSDRFVNALSFANEQIKQARGIKSDGNFELYTSDAGRLEAHNAFLVLYSLSADAGSFVSNTMGGGAMGKVIRFSDIEILEIETGDNGKVSLHLRWNIQENVSEKLLPLNDVNRKTAEEIIEFVRNYSQNSNEKETADAENPAVLLDDWNAVTGKERDFQFMGRTLHVSKERDLYNTYRLRYAKMSGQLATSALKEYQDKVFDLATFLEFYPEIYGEYLDIAVKKTVDVCIMEGIYTLTADQLKQNHLKSHHKGLDSYNQMMESLGLTQNENRKAAEKTLNGTPVLSGGGFGVKGAAKGILSSSVFNAAVGAVSKNVAKGQLQLNQRQQAELYARIQPDNLFQLVQNDYFCLVLTLASILGTKKMDALTQEAVTQAQGIFENLSNPNFPKEKKADMMLYILQQNPYNEAYHKYLMTEYGATEEIRKIAEYFGFSSVTGK